MWNWENKKIGAMRYSRYIASYLKVITDLDRRFYEDEFEEWLNSFEGEDKLTDEQISNILEMATCGRLEAETHCMRWFNKKGIKRNNKR